MVEGFKAVTNLPKTKQSGVNGGKPFYHGHRQRLRERFLKDGFNGFAPHEVVELLLTLAIPRTGLSHFQATFDNEFIT